MDNWSTAPAATYAENAIAFRKALGATSHPIISRQKHPREWREWYAYYAFRKLLASQAMMREKDEKTVPTLSPLDFDAAFSCGHDLPDVPKGDREPGAKITDADRARHAERFPAFLGNAEFLGRADQSDAPGTFKRARVG